MFRNYWFCQSEASDTVTNFSVLSNPADARNVSKMRLWGRDFCSKSYAMPCWVLSTFTPSVVSIYIINKLIKWCKIQSSYIVKAFFCSAGKFIPNTYIFQL